MKVVSNHAEFTNISLKTKRKDGPMYQSRHCYFRTHFDFLRLSGIFGEWINGLEALTNIVERECVTLERDLAAFFNLITSFTRLSIKKINKVDTNWCK